MTNKIAYCLWCNDNATEVLEFYSNTFPRFKLLSRSDYPGTNKLLMAEMMIEDRKFQLLNGNVNFFMNPAISFMLQLENADDVKMLHDKLTDGGKVLMELKEYPWSPCYAWVEDKFGTNWQLYTIPNNAKVNQHIAPSLMFTGKNTGKAEEAINYYTRIFPDSKIQGIMRYPAGGIDKEGTVQHGQFELDGNTFMCMDSAYEHKAEFNESVSFSIACKDQQEVDHYWNAFTAEGKESMCGWCSDKYGISWQVVPEILGKVMSSGTPEQKQRVMQAFMKMHKFDVAELEKASKG